MRRVGTALPAYLHYLQRSGRPSERKEQSKMVLNYREIVLESVQSTAKELTHRQDR